MATRQPQTEFGDYLDVLKALDDRGAIAPRVDTPRIIELLTRLIGLMLWPRRRFVAE